ncbi:hypothetical protein ALC60_04406 [Trachymyrmex zeteki]|uniref:Uncharacterized protein n=1 Tax=Mycetomoellerius zeteki TaxID=64791 RepID=A0A151X8V0_9HYME|nr:hypothetical protein ALC60_04406 [Trachymyrmex zeteki]
MARLLYKLINKKFPNQLIKIIWSMISERSLVVANDLIVYLADSWPSNIQQNLQSLFIKLEYYFETWKLSINIDKCDVVLFFILFN